MNSHWRWFRVILPLMVAAALLAGLSAFSMDVLSSVRAFVAAESQYSKAQKDAVLYLSQYARSHAESDYQNFLHAIAVPLGDRRARLALDQADPDLEAARQGFLAALNHPDDIDGMIRLFRNFRHIGVVRKIIQIWTEGDGYIQELCAEAGKLQVAIISGHADAAAPVSGSGRISQLNASLTTLEDAFTARLGDASRKIQRWLLLATLAIAAALMGGGGFMSLLMLKKNKKFEQTLRISEERLDLAMRGSSDGMWDWDLRAGSVYYSPRLKQLLEEDSPELVHAAKNFSKYIYLADFQRMRAHVKKYLADNDLYYVEFRIITQSGKVRWVSSRALSMLDSAGKPVRMAGSITDITERKQAEEALRQSRASLRKLVGHLERVKEDERKRIAREIHDELGQNLLALRIDVAMMAGHPHSIAITQERVNAALEQIDTTIKSVRAIINNLRPAVLDLGLHAAIEWQAMKFERRSGIMCELNIDHDEFDVDNQHATALFRIVQESLTNIVRHAKASHVQIDMQRRDGGLVLKIADNGIGLLPESGRKAGAFGLVGIEERIHALGGTFATANNLGPGMTVTVSIPLPA